MNDITISTYHNNAGFPVLTTPQQDLVYAQAQAQALQSAAQAAQAMGRVWIDDDGCIHWILPTSTTEG